LANDQLFTAAIYGIFHLLKSWDVHKDGYIQLSIRDVYSITDHLFLRHSSPSATVHKTLLIHRGEDNKVVDLWNWRHRYSYLRLLHPSELPTVPVVDSFITYFTTRNICDRVPIEIAARLPNLRVSRWRMNDWEMEYITLRRTHRYDLAQAVAKILPRSSNLQSLNLSMRSTFSWVPRFSSGTLHPENPTFDTLSNAFRVATAGINTLRELSINCAIDASLLWPGPNDTLSEPYWQNLEYLTVHFSTRRPSGGCYFWDPQQTISEPLKDMPPGYGYREEDDVTAASQFSPREHIPSQAIRRAPILDDVSLELLIEAFGRACSQIPSLKSAELSTMVPAPVELDNGQYLWHNSPWGVWYFSPGTSPRTTKIKMDPAFFEYTHQRRIFWDVKEWRPSADLRTLLRNIGCEKYGIHVVERFIDTWNTVRKDQALQDYLSRQSSTIS
jgi:hypothetical protein